MTAVPRSGKRRATNNAKRPQVIIFAEGSKTEPTYFTHWYRLHRDRVIVKVAPHEHTAPLELVRMAVLQKERDTREAKRGRGDAFDQYWCVFDVDEHPKINEALALAEAHGINVALSNPCIEFWFLIHFENHAAYLERSTAQQKSRGHLKCDKALTSSALDLLVEHYDTAKERAQKLDTKHRDDGTAYPGNPSSNVWSVVDFIRGYT